METNGEALGKPSANGQAAPFRLHYDAWHRLVLTDAAGREHVGIEPVRAFPITAPTQGLALCDADGREVLWVEDLADLPADLRRAVEEDLARRHFVPVLRRVLKVSAPVEPSEWEVETDRGGTTFVLKSEEDVRRLPDHRAMLVDGNGVRYLIPDVRALDATSRRFLERYL